VFGVVNNCDSRANDNNNKPPPPPSSTQKRDGGGLRGARVCVRVEENTTLVESDKTRNVSRLDFADRKSSRARSAPARRITLYVPGVVFKICLEIVSDLSFRLTRYFAHSVVILNFRQQVFTERPFFFPILSKMDVSAWDESHPRPHHDERVFT